ncbi:MAG: hypothetical protein ACYTFW_18225, partial [Planctomycetota bacterium]
MKATKTFKGLWSILIIFLHVICACSYAADSNEEELAKAAQNPVADLISLPFQNNINFDVGPAFKVSDKVTIV